MMNAIKGWSFIPILASMTFLSACSSPTQYLRAVRVQSVQEQDLQAPPVSDPRSGPGANQRGFTPLLDVLNLGLEGALAQGLIAEGSSESLGTEYFAIVCDYINRPEAVPVFSKRVAEANLETLDATLYTLSWDKRNYVLPASHIPGERCEASSAQILQ